MGGYKADMKLTIRNHKKVPAKIQVKYTSYYGSNLVLSWDSSNSAGFEQISSNEYRVIQVVQPDQTIIYQWN
jgi:hypothetical protein